MYSKCLPLFQPSTPLKPSPPRTPYLSHSTSSPRIQSRRQPAQATLLLPAPPSPEPTVTPSIRLLFGPASFDSIPTLARELAPTSSETLTALVICGWNAARAGPLFSLLDSARSSHNIRFKTRQAIAVWSCRPGIKQIRKGMQMIRKYKPDILIAYGGGAVMDVTKILGVLATASDQQVENVLANIEHAAYRNEGRICLQGDWGPGLNVVLVPTTLGGGAEFADACVVFAREKRLLAEIHGPSRRAVVVDSRLVAPRRLRGKYAALGALCLLVRAMESLICMGNGDHALVNELEKAIKDSWDLVLDALREPENATGQSRDALMMAKVRVGLVSDIGRLGIVTRLTLAVVDELVDGAQPWCFEMVAVRIGVAVVQEMNEWGGKGQAVGWAMAMAVEIGDVDLWVNTMLERAEDVDCRLLRELGMVRRKIGVVADRVRETMRRERYLKDLEKRFCDEGVVERIVERAIEQTYQL